jgi:iron complex outermembrane receptor protein
MKALKISQIAVLVGAVCATPALWAQTAPADGGAQAATDVGRISVEGQGDAGLIQAEETPKARSSVNRAHLDTLNPTSNPYQAIELLPGVSTFSYDATGLYGGGLRVRGANSDQMGFTINGAPVNDSGSFAVYPQEYADQENLCEIFVTQGSTDTEAPHIGASGGNIGMTTCGPKDEFGGKVTLSGGQLSFKRAFFRVDTGLFANGMLKAFISVSKADVNKFKGTGSADKKHLDFGAEFRPTKDVTLTTSFLYNKALNDNIRTLNYYQIANGGYDLDFLTTPPQHLTPVNGTAQNEAQTTAGVPVIPQMASCTAGPTAAVPNPPVNCGYYGFNINPFKNYLWTAKAEYKVNKDLSFSVLPYFWYGYGTGGSELQSLAEGLSTSKVGGGIPDLNGDGDTKDTVMVYGGSVTRTYRPGVTLQANARLGDHNILAGVWYEDARHRQTGPRELFDNNGNPNGGFWLDNSNAWIKRADGTPYEARDQLTRTKGSSVFVQDSFYLVPDKLNVTLGLRGLNADRNFTNFANEGAGQNGYYQYSTNYNKVLPSVGLRYTVDSERQVYFNVSQNMKTPGNFSYQGLILNNTGTWNNGVLTGFTLRTPSVQPETSTNAELGYRYAGEALTFSANIYHIAFNNRIATSYDPVSGLSIDTNVGMSQTSGFETEAGFKLNSNWSFYGSFSYTDSTMLENKVCLSASPASCLPTAGKQMPDTPMFLSGLNVTYKYEGFYASLDAKYNGSNYSTLVNDQSVKGVTLLNLSTGYKFANFGFLKSPQVMLNVVNLTNQKYERVNSGSGSQFTYYSQPINSTLNSPSQPSYYVGAPRFTSITLRSDF